MITIYKVTKTDERLFADYVVPGVSADQILVTSVAARYEDFEGVKKGSTFTVKIAAANRGSFGVFKELNAETLKDVQNVPFEFDINSLSWNVSNGILRVSIPRKAEFVGKTVVADTSAEIFGEVLPENSVTATK